MHTKAIFLFAASILPALVSCQSGVCYFPAGNIAYGNVPCDLDAAVSSCCSSQENCLSNGLCLVNDDRDTVEFARGACTDPTFESPECFSHCLESRPGSPKSNGAAVFECGTVGWTQPANYCCENGINAKLACCNTPSLIFQLPAATLGAMAQMPAPSTVTVTSTVGPIASTDSAALPTISPASTTTAGSAPASASSTSSRAASSTSSSAASSTQSSGATTTPSPATTTSTTSSSTESSSTRTSASTKPSIVFASAGACTKASLGLLAAIPLMFMVPLF